MKKVDPIEASATLAEALKVAEKILDDAGVPSPAHDARALAAFALDTQPLALDRRGPVPEGFGELISRRANREPLQHIMGTAAFGHLDIAVGPGVFIPRPETELLADWGHRQSLQYADPVVVDLCTGSGAIAQYIASLNERATVIGVEKQASALDYALKNAPEVKVVQGDVHEMVLPELHGTVDVVVTNPPYVPRDPNLEAEVYQDPDEAVFSGADGLDTIRAMMPLIMALLKPGGVVGMEHDESHAEEVREIARAAGLSAVETRNDLTSRPRFMLGSKVEESGEHPKYERFLS